MYTYPLYAKSSYTGTIYLFVNQTSCYVVQIGHINTRRSKVGDYRRLCINDERWMVLDNFCLNSTDMGI